MAIAPVRFGMPVSERARAELKRQRAAETERLQAELAPFKADTEKRLTEAETLSRINRLPWPKNPGWHEDEYRFREYVKLETELLEKQEALEQDKANRTQREISETGRTITDFLSCIHHRQQQLMQNFSIAALDRMTTWLAGNGRFRTQIYTDLARHFRKLYDARK